MSHDIYVDNCFVFHPVVGDSIPSPTMLTRLKVTRDELPNLKRKLLHMFLTYPDIIPLRCSTEMLLHFRYLSELISQCGERYCPATARHDHYFIEKREIKQFLRNITRQE